MTTAEYNQNRDKFEHYNTGKVLVKDKNNNAFSVYRNDERLVSKELMPINTGNKYKLKNKREQLACKCGKICDASNFKRWGHGDNCER
jgi:hypothetical protein